MNVRSSLTLLPLRIISPIFKPTPFAAQPKCVSSTWPTFIRDGTPSGFSTMSTGVPSAMYGMASTGTIVEMIPLHPVPCVRRGGHWRHVRDRHDRRDDALGAVPARHLVAGLHAPLHGEIDLDHLQHAGREIVGRRDLLLLLAAASVG